MHITHEWGDDGPRHGFPLPNTLVHGVVERVFHTTISERGTVVGARFRPGGFTARFDRDAAALTVLCSPSTTSYSAGQSISTTTSMRYQRGSMSSSARIPAKSIRPICP